MKDTPTKARTRRTGGTAKARTRRPASDGPAVKKAPRAKTAPKSSPASAPARPPVAKGHKAPAATPYQQAKRDRRRREILDAAAEVFAEKGYFATTIQDIADRIEMRPGSLYYHLASKEEALAEVCRIGGQAFIDGAESVRASGKSVPDMIRDGIRLHLDARWRDYVSNFAFNRGMLPENVLTEMNGFARGYLDVWAKILEHGQSEGALAQDLDPRTAAAALLSICNGAVSANPDGADAEAVAHRVFRLFMGGMEAR